MLAVFRPATARGFLFLISLWSVLVSNQIYCNSSVMALLFSSFHFDLEIGIQNKV